MKAERIQLAPEVEVTELYLRPSFTELEKLQYFTLTKHEKEALSYHHNIKTRLFFILQTGYFRAKQQFFDFKLEEVNDDVSFIVDMYLQGQKVYARHKTGRLSRMTSSKQKEAILGLFKYSNWSQSCVLNAQLHLSKLLKLYPKVHSSFRHMLIYFENNKIIIPTYRTFQDVFTDGIAAEEGRLDATISVLPVSITKELNQLNNKNEGITAFNTIRADQKSFRYTDLRFEISKANQIKSLYVFSKQFLPKLDISNNAIQHYAEIAEQYAASRLRKLTKLQQHLHILCFVNHRYQQIMDNLLTSFIYHVKAIKKSANVYASMLQLTQGAKLKADFPRLVQFLKWFPERDQCMSQNQIDEHAYQILPKEQFSVLANYLAGKAFNKKAALWDFYSKSSRKVALYLRPIFSCIDWGYYKEQSYVLDLMEIISIFYGSGKSISKLKISDELGITLPKSMIPYLQKADGETEIDPHLFEWFTFLKVEHELSRGRLFCNDSIAYRDIDKDLIHQELVDDAINVATELGFPNIVNYCDERLDLALYDLECAWKNTVANIQQKKNTGFKLKTEKDGTETWHLLYDSKKSLDDAFFKQLPKLDIASIVMYIGNKTELWDAFSHIKDRYVKRRKPASLQLTACLISEAFGFGIQNMAEMSDLEFNQLRSTREDFLRVDTLCLANDAVCNFTHSVPLFKCWDLIEGKVLADADGQKASTSDDTIQSRYSRKYLGKGRGISIYTLLANFVAVNAKNIGLNEYEGHMLYDMIYGNKTDIDINMVTGDNHSLNKLNFVVLDSIDVDYVPCIRNVRDAAEKLYSVDAVEDTGLLKPKKQVDVELIRSQKSGIIRVLLSLLIQQNTQSHIIRKLNSHKRYSRLRAALSEYNSIFKSIHTLNLMEPIRYG